MQSILYIQYNNPGAYPPLENSSQILAGRGFQVWMFGVQSPDTIRLVLPETPGIRLELMAPAGLPLFRKLAYPRFLFFSLLRVLTRNPNWIYVSDPMAAPIGWIAKRVLGRRVIYHEHDAPARSVGLSSVYRRILALRNSLVRLADEVVVPQAARAAKLQDEAKTRRPIHCIWNCPRPSEAAAAENRLRPEGQPLGVYYHGSINLNRTPPSLVEGCARSGVPIRLRIVGYETIGSRGSIAELKSVARRCGGSLQLEFIGPQPRSALRSCMSGMHVGWINCLRTEEDSNLTDLFGASNKAFDYLAASMPLLVSDDPVWRENIADPGFGYTCEAGDPDSIAAALRLYYQNPGKTAAMGEAGRMKIVSTWNYDHQFAPLSATLAKN